MTGDLLALLIAGISMFLVGANVAIVYRFWPEPWLTAKMAAVSTLLIYTSLSVLYGDPAAWRMLIGLFAVCADAGAVAGMWHAMNKASAAGQILYALKRR